MSPDSKRARSHRERALGPHLSSDADPAAVNANPRKEVTPPSRQADSTAPQMGLAGHLPPARPAWTEQGLTRARARRQVAPVDQRQIARHHGQQPGVVVNLPRTSASEMPRR